MPLLRDPVLFTRNELVERLKAAKEYIGNKERIAYLLFNHKILIDDYDPTDDDSFFRRTNLDTSWMTKHVEEMFGKYQTVADLPRHFSGPTYCVANQPHLREICSVVPIAMFPYKGLRITKCGVLWVGTWHYAPVLAWKSTSIVSDRPITIEKLPAYSDLI